MGTLSQGCKHSALNSSIGRCCNTTKLSLHYDCSLQLWRCMYHC